MKQFFAHKNKLIWIATVNYQRIANFQISQIVTGKLREILHLPYRSKSLNTHAIKTRDKRTGKLAIRTHAIKYLRYTVTVNCKVPKLRT